MIKTYGRIRILGRNYDVLVPKKYLVVDQTKRVKSGWTSRSNIYIRLDTDDHRLHRGSCLQCPLCGSAFIGYRDVKLTDTNKGATATGWAFTCGTLFMLGTVGSNNAMIGSHGGAAGNYDYDDYFNIGARPALPAILDRQCVGQLIEPDDVI